MKNRIKFPVLFSLYIAQSVPMSFFSTVVPVIMRQENYSLASIGLLQLVKIPWIIKFLWAPLVDNSSRGKNQLRNWILASELFYAFVIIMAGFFSLKTDFTIIVILIIIAFLASATQDIATDIFAIRILKTDERAFGNSMQSAGIFAGSLIGTGVLLIAYTYFGWSKLLFLLAAFVVFAVLPAMIFSHHSGSVTQPQVKKTGLKDVLLFFDKRDNRNHLLLLIFFYAGLTGILSMAKPFLVDLGYGTKEIGFISGIAGTATAILAALAGGTIIRKAGRKISFYSFAALNVVTTLYFIWLTGHAPSHGEVYAGICLLWGAYGLSTVIIYTSSMDRVRAGSEGSDFTVQIAVTHLSGLLVAVAAGKIGDEFGYRGLFFAESLAAIFAFTLVIFNYPLKESYHAITMALVSKYNGNVPRYTSYPPANRFKDYNDQSIYRDLLLGSNEKRPGNISVYIHIPFCHDICTYCGCNSMMIRGTREVSQYVSAVCHEIEIVSGLLDKKRKVTQVHFGGGTPNSLDAAAICSILSKVRDSMGLDENAETAIECNPAYMGTEYLKELLDNGFNRFSFGIQDFDDNVLMAVNRKPSALPAWKLLEFVRNYNQSCSVNFDFIYGLPGQTKESFSDTIKKAIAIRPDRLVTFSYAHIPHIKIRQKLLEQQYLPGPEQKTEMFLRSREILVKNGYEPVGFDHYVLPGDELRVALLNGELHRNFQGYCTRKTTGQVYAFGVSGITQLDDAYVQNTMNIDKYIAEVSNGNLASARGIVLTSEEKLVRNVISEIMCNQRLDVYSTAAKSNITARDLLKICGFRPEKLSPFIDDGLVKFEDGRLTVNESGILFLRNIASLFDPGFKQGSAEHSKSI